MSSKPKVLFVGAQESADEKLTTDIPPLWCERAQSGGDAAMRHVLVLATTRSGKTPTVDEIKAKYRNLGYEAIVVPPPNRARPDPLPAVKVDEFLTLPGKLFRDASNTVHDILGCDMTQEGVARFLSVSRIGANILWFNEVETQIRDSMWSALRTFLTGEDSWIDSGADYKTQGALLRAAARARGYLKKLPAS